MTKNDKTKITSRKRKKSTNSERFTRWAIAIGAVVLLIVVPALLYVVMKYRPNIVIDKNEYPIMGVDISKHNGNIDFKTLAANKLSFVIAKATEGTDYNDPLFEHNYSAAKAVGLKVGAYHFFSMKKDGRLQAENFLRSIKGKQLDLPLVIDVEEWEYDFVNDPTDAIEQLTVMSDYITQQGYKVMVYTNKNGYKKFIKERLSHLPLWICSFQHPHRVRGYNWTILQYSHWGEVDGIKGEVDLDVFNGDSLAWERWLQAI